MGINLRTIRNSNNMNELESDEQTKLVNAEGLLEALFEPRARPSLRWVRQMQAQRRIPYLKIGHLVFFDVERVRIALEEKCTVRRL